MSHGNGHSTTNTHNVLVFVSVNSFQRNRLIGVKGEGRRRRLRGRELRGGRKGRRRKKERKTDFKELIHGIMGTNKSEICRADQHAGL